MDWIAAAVLAILIVGVIAFDGTLSRVSRRRVSASERYGSRDPFRHSLPLNQQSNQNMRSKFNFVSTYSRVLCAAAALSAYGCDSSHDDDDGGARPLLAAFNAVPDMATITFLREEEVWSALDFGVGTEFRSVDADQYDVNFDSRLPGDETTTCRATSTKTMSRTTKSARD